MEIQRKASAEWFTGIMNRVPLDKSEVSVKGVVVLGGTSAPPALPSQRRLRTKTLEISR